jgi:uncharacterized protein (TIGR03086 family)
MTEIADRYRRRADAFERTIVGVRPEQWSNASPCEEWTARDVVDHIVVMHGAMLSPIGRRLSPAPSVQDNALEAFRAAREDVARALDDPQLAKAECPTPVGPMTLERHVDEVVSADLVIHGWDLARAVGQDTTMDPRDVEAMWQAARAIPEDVMEKYRTPGAFGPGITVYGPLVQVDDDAPLQDQLLGLLGRDPAWEDRRQ